MLQLLNFLMGLLTALIYYCQLDDRKVSMSEQMIQRTVLYMLLRALFRRKPGHSTEQISLQSTISLRHPITDDSDA